MHARQIIREAMIEKIRGIDGLGDHLTQDKDQAEAAKDLPWAYVWLGDERLSQNLSGKKTRDAQGNIELIGRLSGPSTAAAESIAAVIEDRCDADPHLENKVASLRLTDIQVIENAERSLRSFRMVFRVIYFTAAGAASTPI